MRLTFRARIPERARSEDWSDLRLTSFPLSSAAWSRSRQDSADLGCAAWREPDRRDTNMEGGMRLRIANQYDWVDARVAVPRGYVHVPGKRLQPLCRRLGIRYAEAMIDLRGFHGYVKPVRDGVVVHVLAAPRLLAAIAAREARSQLRLRRRV